MSNRLMRAALVSVLAYSVNAIAHVPNTNRPLTFVGPTLQGSYSDWLSESTAYSVLGELGVRNLRVSATTGWRIDQQQRIKVTGEYLWQRLAFAFFAGDTKRWVQQGAVGAAYQHDLEFDFISGFEVSGYASDSPSENLTPIYGTYLQNGIPHPYSDIRRLAGAKAAGISPALVFGLWPNSRMSVALNYDYVRYDKRYWPDQNGNGLGGTAKLQQELVHDFALTLSAAIRRPFNNFAGAIERVNLNYYGRWSAGLYGEYTSGRDTLPNSYNVGININYYADRFVSAMIPGNYKGDVKNEAPFTALMGIRDKRFFDWVSDPAVYMPQVLAIADEKINRCTLGNVTTTGVVIPLIVTSVPVTVATAPSFSGNDLTYTISVAPNLIDGDNIGISTTTGLVTITPGIGRTDRTYAVHVTASNVCGSAGTQFSVFIPGGVG